MNALYAKARRCQNTALESFRGRLAPRFQRLQNLFTQGLVKGSQSVEDSGREELMELHRSISECEGATKGWLSSLVGGALSSPGTSAAVLKANGTGGASGAGPSK